MKQLAERWKRETRGRLGPQDLVGRKPSVLLKETVMIAFPVCRLLSVVKVLMICSRDWEGMLTYEAKQRSVQIIEP